ncbi:hypothetical protein Tco_0841467 [Tanacetum coccineum]|uniref:Uncharacterized protein n=1 Tax=Tanacetum coccineum TaxID=301880 RepID=A0ABQ5AWN5_9ASTR
MKGQGEHTSPKTLPNQGKVAKKSSVTEAEELAAVTITPDPCPTRAPLWWLQWKSPQSLGLVQDPTLGKLGGDTVYIHDTPGQRRTYAYSRRFPGTTLEIETFEKCRSGEMWRWFERHRDRSRMLAEVDMCMDKAIPMPYRKVIGNTPPKGSIDYI